jgi:hypothetical protein
MCMQGKSPIKAKLGQKNEFYFDEKAGISVPCSAQDLAQTVVLRLEHACHSCSGG